MRSREVVHIVVPIALRPYIERCFSDQGRWLRFKSVQRIIKEVEYYLQNSSVEYFYFVSETFLAMPPYERESFYNLYNKYSLPFWFNTRPETVNSKDINALADIGCHRLSVGIEHGNQEFRRKMLKRNYSNMAVVDAVNIIQETNIQISVNNMIGFPDETRDLVFDTINLNRDFSCDSHTVSVFPSRLKVPSFMSTVLKETIGAKTKLVLIVLPIRF